MPRARTAARDKGLHAAAFIKWIFTAIGTGLLAVAMYQVWSTHRFISRAVELPGEVVRLIPHPSNKGGPTYSAEVAYAGPDERPRTVTSSFSTSPPAYDVGESVVVLHDPTGERDPQIQGFFSQWGVVVIAGGMGVVFFGVGLGIMFGGRRRRRKNRLPLDGGQPIEARIQGVGRNESVTVDGRHPFVVLCQWLDPRTREVYVFQSEDLWFDPTPYLDREELRVLIDPGNPRRYRVDLSFLPGLAG